MVTERSRRQLAPGKVFAGKFLLEANFASGSMGSMWRARDTQRDAAVAIKVMISSIADSPGFVTRFEREASAAARIGSPHIVSIFEFGMHNEQPYIVMELLEGEDLHHRLQREPRLSLRATMRLVRGICEGLYAAHENGIIHRDLKPANIFLARDGDAEVVKLLDFGIAKIAQDEGTGITATGQMIGTPNYMSPEQIQGASKVDHRADLWAVGVIAFRALTGQLPFTGHTVQVIRAILHDAAPPPSSIAEGLSPAVDEFFARALARDISQRFQSARELSEALATIARREPPESGATGPTSLLPGSLPPAPRPGEKKPPSSWKVRPPVITEREPEPDGSPNSFRRVIPVDAPLLPVSLPARESAPPDEPRALPTPSMAPEVPSKPPSAPTRMWLVWTAAALVVVATLLGVMLLAARP